MDRIWPVLRIFLMWYAFQTFMGKIGFNNQVPGGPATTTTTTTAIDGPSPLSPPPFSPSTTTTTTATTAAPSTEIQRSYRNSFSPGDRMALRVYVSPNHQFSFADLDAATEREQLRWHVKDLTYSSSGNPQQEDETWRHALNISVDDHLLVHNGSLFAHVFLTKSGFSPNPRDSEYDHTATTSRSVELTTFRARPKIAKVRNLLSSASTDQQAPHEDAAVVAAAVVAEEGPSTFVAMWKPFVTVNVVFDNTVFSAKLQPPPFIRPYMQFDKPTQTYLPVLHINEFWLLEEKILPINGSVTSLPLELTFYPLPIYKFALYTQMEQNFKNQETAGATTRKDTDSMKRMFMETNPYLLGITMLVSLLHSLFDFLAFKNDVSFWKNQKSLAGLSLRTIVLNTFFQLVIFLYLLDNDTSWMVLMSSLMSLVIDFWKIKKAIVISRDVKTNKLQVTGVESYNASPTAEHDRVAVAHLSYVLYPLIVGYAAFSLVQGEHKGWYSWVVKSLTSFVYMFGFIMMTPQLYINYKLKSVAHLPWRAMVYKSLNTFIDDLFAFVIKMPWMHRLSCFRDDLIFFINLYQRWIYPIDANRTNEFGQGGKEKEEEEKDAAPPPQLLAQEEEKEDEDTLGVATFELETDTTGSAGSSSSVAETETSSKYLRVVKQRTPATATTTSSSSS